MHVIANAFQIAVPTGLHDQGCVAPTENMPTELVPMIQTNGESAQQPSHPRDQVCVRRLDDQMKMIAHEAIRVDLKAGFLAGFRQGLEEILSIHIVQENVLAAISAAHDVVDGPLILDSHFARHGPESAESRPLSQTKMNQTM